jgi:phosphoribosyl 1,2-cyclic phosphodiesterase
VIRFASLGSGSAGNALLVESEATCLMLDCGFGLRETVARLQNLGRQPSDISGILVTHEHGDHVGGVFRFARKFSLPVWMTHGSWVACGESDLGLDLHIIDSHRSLTIGDLEVQPFPVPHDAREPVQYIFSDPTFRLGVLTDIGEITPHVRDLLSGCDGLVLEFNHDAQMLAQSSYPVSLKRRIAGRYGHLENSAAVGLLNQIWSPLTSVSAIIYPVWWCAQWLVFWAVRKAGWAWRRLIWVFPGANCVDGRFSCE